jgi:hypothetical protein
LRKLAGADLGASDWLTVTGPFGVTSPRLPHPGRMIPLWTHILQMEGVAVAVNYGLNRIRMEPIAVLPAPGR